MKKYTLKELVEEVTGIDDKHYIWESQYELGRRIKKMLDTLFGDNTITDKNIDKYIRAYKLIYIDQDIKALIGRYCRIIETIQKDENSIFIPYIKKDFSTEEMITIFKVLSEFYKGEKIGDFIEYNLTVMRAEEYNKILNEFEYEVERIKTSIHGYTYKEKVKKMNEIKNYLKMQREEIDKKIEDSLILPY